MLAIGERLPVFYGGQSTGGVACWKTDVEENAKRFALAGAIPDGDHNEVEAWRAPAGAAMRASSSAIAESPEIARRFGTARADRARHRRRPRVLGARRGRPARLLGLAYIGAWTSYYLAVGPSRSWPVPLLGEIKRRLRAG